MSENKTGRVISQDDWKRTQVRMPHEQHDAILAHAERRNLSLNAAMLDLMDIGLDVENTLIQGKNINSIFIPRTSIENCHINEIDMSKIRAFFSVNTRFELINIETKSDGFICWYYNNHEKASEFNGQYDDYKVSIYIEIPEYVETPFYFPPVIEQITKTFKSVINFRSVEPVSGNYHNIKMTFHLYKTYPAAYHEELENTIKSIIFNGTGFYSKISFEKI